MEFAKPITYVYIDGYNLYYGCFKSGVYPEFAKYKWLDLEKFCDLLFPQCHVAKIKYYTARVKGGLDSERQNVYLRALGQLSRLEIIYGKFLANTKRLPLYENGKRGKQVTVLNIEEKGSDVNLAIDLLEDCFLSNYQRAYVISNDSDLIRAILKVRQTYKKKVGIVNPHFDRTGIFLRRRTDFHEEITESLLANSQFPDEIQVGKTTLRRPDSWR